MHLDADSTNCAQHTITNKIYTNILIYATSKQESSP